MDYQCIKVKLQGIINAIDESEVPVKLPPKTELITSRIEAAITDIKFYRLTGQQINDLLVSTLAHIEDSVASNKIVDRAFRDLRVKYDNLNNLNTETHRRFEAKCHDLENALLEAAKNHSLAIKGLEMQVVSKQELLRVTRDQHFLKIRDLENEIEALRTHVNGLTNHMDKRAPRWTVPNWQYPHYVQTTPFLAPNIVYTNGMPSTTFNVPPSTLTINK